MAGEVADAGAEGLEQRGARDVAAQPQGSVQLPGHVPRFWNRTRQPAERSGLTRRLEKLDGIAVWIQDLDLTSRGSGFRGVPKRRSGAAQCVDDPRQVLYPKNNAI